MGARVLLCIGFALTVAARAGASAGETPLPFIQALARLETHEQKVQHVRSWHPSMGVENGLTDVDHGLRFEALLALYLFHYVNDAGVLDCEELAIDLRMAFDCLFEIDDPEYRLYTLVFEDLCPAQQGYVRARCGR